MIAAVSLRHLTLAQPSPPAAEYIRMLSELGDKIAVITNDDDAVAALDELTPTGAICGHLSRLIMHRAIAEDTDVRPIEEIGDAGRLPHRILRFIR